MDNNISSDFLLSLVKTYIHNEKDIVKIKKAFDFSYEKHKGQLRKSGEPYFIHPVKVAELLAEYKLGPDTIISGLLHDVVEDTDCTLEELVDNFGDDVGKIVDGVTKISQYKFNSKKESVAHTHQKLIIAMSQDLRVILVKLADRLHNMRTIEHVSPEKKGRICRETLEIYAPIAHRLGMYRLKAELEDLSFKQLEEEKYNSISLSLSKTKEERDYILNEITDQIKEELEKVGTHYSIKGRIKNIYSIYKKMEKKDRDFTEIYDLVALRIIVDSVEECYRVLGIIHSIYKPAPNRFKDYIAIPKVNLYQSLHTTILSPKGIFEIQIRTTEMDEIAEKGVAAHWAYKEGRSIAVEQNEIRESLAWYNDLVKMSDTADGINSEEFVNSIKEDLTASVFIFTPVGEVYMLPQGSTPVDFAYKIHTEVGNTCVGAVVNKKMVTLDYVLKSNDIVEIKTSKSSKGPTEDWLKFCKTNVAKSKIKTFINVRDYDKILEVGKKKFEDITKEYGIVNTSDDHIQKVFDLPEIKNINDLYYQIGKNVISARIAYNKLVGKKVIDESVLLDQIVNRNISKKSTASSSVLVEGLDNPLIKLSNCCNPIPGDEIIGYVSKGMGIAVHRKNCTNIIDKDIDRFITVKWNEDVESPKFKSNLRAVTFKGNQLLSDIIAVLSTNNSAIQKYSSKDIDSQTQEIEISINTKNTEVLNKIISNIEKIKNVIKVERI